SRTDWCSNNNLACIGAIYYNTNYISTQKSVYYNYFTATAGHNTLNNIVPGGDLCPSGWRLPTIAEYQALGTALDLSNNYQLYLAAPTLLTYTGYYKSDSNTLSYTGSQGHLWTRNPYSAYAAYSSQIYINSNGIATAALDKTHGLPIRCIQK
ncbi:hypothetical protein IJI17_02245, partial [Candidatus Saccharibacteria bacterium]|nr:hypothetical protein [Candidatus Saccharibacteria bacterium]